MRNIPLYIHIPFCSIKCKYCDFYSVGYLPELASEYIQALVKQIENLKRKGASFSSVYIGGGTPSVLDCSLFEKLLSAIPQNPEREFTIEINPESINPDKLHLLKYFNVNRLSVGVQSFYDEVLSFLGRKHACKRAIDAISLSKKTGFDNLSIDLMYGVPKKSFSKWKEELKIVRDLPIKHVSLYSLIYNKGTILFEDLKRQQFKPVSSEEEADMYLYGVDFLEKINMFQYEVSNFAFTSFESKHNLRYWSNSSYLGLGPGAASYIDKERYKYKNDIYEYINKVNTPLEENLIEERERLSPFGRAKETAALNMRRKEGVNFKEFKEDTGYEFLEIEKEVVNNLIKQGLLVQEDSNIRLTKRGFFLCDYVCRELL